MATRSIGLRALRHELREVMANVSHGDEVLVTDRGKPVARISPVGKTHDLLDKLAREGRLRRARRHKPQLTEESLIQASGSVSGLIVEERERLRNPSA